MNNVTEYDLISVEDLASILEISRGSAYNLLKSGEIKCFRIGSHYKIPACAVTEYIRRMSGLSIAHQ